MSSSPAPGPSWPCGSVSPTWLTHLCPNGLGAHGLSRVPQPRMNPEWAPCAPPSWAWVGGSSLPRSGPSSLAHPVSGPSSLAHPVSGPSSLAHPRVSGPSSLCHPHVSGPSSLCHPHISGPSRLAHPHVSGPSSLCPSSRLRAQQPLPIPTSQGPVLSGLPLPPNACRFVRLQDMVLLAWCAQGRVHLPMIPSLVSVGVHVCVCVHICPEYVMTASWGGE